MYPQVNPYGSAGEKKALQTKSNFFVLGAIVCGVLPIASASSVSASVSDVLVLFLIPAIVFWFFGLGFYAKSKGYPALMCLLGFLSILGLLVLLILPDQWKAALKREAEFAKMPPVTHGGAAYPR